MDILMPQLGETVAEGKITVWYKSVGDKVAAGDSLFEIETDKTSMEVPTTEAGVLTEIRVVAGATVPVGSIVAVLASGAQSSSAGTGSAAAAPSVGSASTAAAASAAQGSVTSAAHVPQSASATSLAPAAQNTRVSRPFDPANPVHTPTQHYGSATLRNGTKVTPVARRLAAESGVDLGGLKGSGPHGHIVARDVQAAAGAGKRAAGGAGVSRANGASGAALGAAPSLPAPSMSSAQIKARRVHALH